MERIRLPSGSDALPGCCICKVGCRGRGYNDSRKEFVPLVLKCTHSSCESCILACLNMNKPITCGVCQEVSPSPPSYKEEDIRALFPVNMHLLGLWSKKTKEYFEGGDSQISFPKKAVKKEITSKKSNVSCSECTGPADCFCQSCRSAYCRLCFKKVHAAAKVFKGHKSVSLVQETRISSSKSLMCNIHHDKKLELFCIQCCVSICSACLVSEHNGHTLKSLADQNKEMLNEIVASYAKATDVMNIMRVSTKKAQQAMKYSSDGSLNASYEQMIKQHFVQLHAQLEILENDLLLKLNSSSMITSLNEAIESLSENIDRIKTTLTKTESAVKSEGFVDFVGLVKELRDLEHLPCILYTSENNDNKSCLEIDPSIFKTLNEHIVLRADDSVSYQLKNENDAPDEALEDLPNACSLEEIKSQLLPSHPFRPPSSNAGPLSTDCDGVKSGRAVSPVISKWSSSSSLSSNNSFVMEATQLLAQPDDLVVGLTFVAFVSHITSPSDFYIQRFGVKRKLDSLQREMRRYGSHIQKKRQQIACQVGQYYMCVYSGDCNWSRCQILDFVGQDEVKILYIDFGNHQKVLKSTLRPLPESLAQIPPFAVRCSIFNCYPRRNKEWDPKVVSLMSRIMEGRGRTSITIVRKNQLNCLTIKLYKETETNTIDVGEALIFLEFAQCGPSESYTQDVGEIVQPKPYPPQIMLKDEDVEHKTVSLTHVVSPDEFYIVVNPVSVAYQNMWKSMLENYSTLNRRINDSRIVYYPAVGMAVAVANREGSWRRGLVVEMLPKKIVKVFLVDDGQTCMAEWDKLRTLEFKYFKLQPLAYRCSMAGIQPKDGKEWPTEAAALIESYKGKTLRIATQEPMINHTSVLLIHSGTEVDICVNALLVRNGLAESVGPYGDIVEYPKVPIVVTPEEPLVSTQRKDLKVVQRTAHRQPVKQTKKPKEEDDEDGDLVVETEDGLRFKVTVVRVVNPGEFHVSIDKMNNYFERLNIELNEFYENFHGEKREWHLDDTCAVKTDDGSWKRAVVTKEPDRKTHVEVHLVDEDLFMSVPTAPDRLAVLDPQFTSVHQQVIECMLGGIVPAGSSSWTLTSITEMNEFISSHKNNLYIAQMRKRPEDESRYHAVPVTLFGRHIPKPLATEPNRVDWHNLNHSLRWKGFAKADEYTKWDHKGKFTYINDNTMEKEGPLRNNTMEKEGPFMIHLLTSHFALTLEGKLDLCTPSSNCLGTTKLKWPPAVPLVNFNFVARTTFVGNNCDIWIQDPMAATVTLNKINEEATKMCEGTDPPDPSTWETGDICLGKFYLDNKWYRAEIVELNATHIHHLVRFVDYGNEEYLEPHDLRYAEGMTLRPIQAHICYFDNLTTVTGDTWPANHINGIHSLLVDKHVCVSLRVLSNNLLGIEKMLLPDGKDALAEIIARNLGVYHTDSPAGSEKSNSKIVTSEIKSDSREAVSTPGVSQQNTAICKNDVESREEGAASIASQDMFELPKGGYQWLTIPSDVTEMEVDITSILSPEVCSMQISKTDNAELNSISDSYNELVKTMQLEAESQPTLEPPYLSKDCCCKFEEDNMWYRAVVAQDSSDQNGTLMIQFVDYGNVQNSPIDKVKQMKDSWFSVPVQAIPCCIDGYYFRQDIPEREAMESLQSVLIDQPYVKAVIKKREKDLLVDFYNEEGQLLYQPLIDSEQLLPSSTD